MKTKAWVLAFALMLSALSMQIAWTQLKFVSATHHWPYPESDQDGIFAVLASGDTIWAGTDSKYLQISYDRGETWVQIGPDSGLVIPWGTVRALAWAKDGSMILAADSTYRSTNNGTRWNKVVAGWDAFLVTKSGVIFAGGGTRGRGIIKSTDNGVSWSVIADSVLRTTSFWTGFVETSSGTFLASTGHAGLNSAEGVFRSTDNGKTWKRSNAGLTDSNIVSMAVDLSGRTNHIYVTTYMRGAFYSDNNGLTWNKVQGITENYGGGTAVTSRIGAFLGFAIFNRPSLYWLSPEVGKPWTALTFQGNGVVCMTENRTRDNEIVIGTNWGIYIATFDYAATPVENEKSPNTVPTEFALSQNYPNPFNPMTTIEFSVPKRATVHLAAYNTLGQKVATLISSEMGAGAHRIEWNAASMPSGIYFYRLETSDGFKATKKMLLVK